MPKVELNPMFHGISGKMGDVVFRASKSGKTYIAKAPKKSKDKPSEAQLAQQRVMNV